MEQILKLFKSLSDENRLKVFLYLLLQNGSKKCVNEISADTNLKQYCVSKCLKEFRSADLVSEDRNGQKVIYHFNSETSDLSRSLIACFQRVRCSEKVLNEDLYHHSRIFKVLSDGNRLKIVLSLLEKEDEKCVQEIVNETGLYYYCVSRGLKELKNAELVEERKDGRNVYYKIKDEQNCFARVTLCFLRVQAVPAGEKSCIEVPNDTI